MLCLSCTHPWHSFRFLWMTKSGTVIATAKKKRRKSVNHVICFHGTEKKRSMTHILCGIWSLSLGCKTKKKASAGQHSFNNAFPSSNGMNGEREKKKNLFYIFTGLIRLRFELLTSRLLFTDYYSTSVLKNLNFSPCWHVNRESWVNCLKRSEEYFKLFINKIDTSVGFKWWLEMWMPSFRILTRPVTLHSIRTRILGRGLC